MDERFEKSVLSALRVLDKMGRHNGPIFFLPFVRHAIIVNSTWDAERTSAGPLVPFFED